MLATVDCDGSYWNEIVIDVVSLGISPQFEAVGVPGGFSPILDAVGVRSDVRVGQVLPRSVLDGRSEGVELMAKETRAAYGEVLSQLVKENKDIVVLDADLSKSTKTFEAYL